MNNLFFVMLLSRLLAVILVYFGIASEHGLYYLLASGIVLGAYYGWFNDIIWRPKGQLSTSLPYRVHQVWIHIISGITGSVALYFLLGVIDINNPILTIERFGWGVFTLLIVAILGYTGLLPRILWFFTYAQNSFK